MEKITINNIEIDPQHFIDKWTNWALEATPATDKQITENIQTLYKKANLNKPKVIVFRDYERFLSNDWVSVKDLVKDSVKDSVWALVKDSVKDSVWALVKDSVWASVGVSVGASVWASVGVSVGDSVWASVGVSVGASVGAWYWVDDMAFVDVFASIKALSQEKIARLEEYKKLLETQRISVLTADTAYILVAPTIRRNDNGQLHSDQRPAVEWENETGQYYLDGVNLPKELWQKIISKDMSLSDIMKIEISDQRTVALKYNPQAIIKENAALIHKDERHNELYLVENSEINTLTNFPKMYFLKMLCPTGRVFIEGVEPSFAEAHLNATECQAELCGLMKSEYTSLLLES